uniref:BICRA like chromatin remodeling complex associated protein n=1 Tax=Tetraodon nigroviridis TaxID=99883 RepID=H3C3S8_TETNG
MDDEDDRHLLDILGDVDALNDYLHGSTGKSIEEDDVTNAAYGADPASFFANDTTISSAGLKDGSSSGGEFGEESAGAGLQLPSSLSFIEDELGAESSPGGVDLEGDEQPFDILQKSLMEADITEQTLAQEALLESQPAPTLVQAPAPFPSQLASGGYGGGVSVVTTAAAAAAFPGGQFLQGVSPLPNGSAQHIQVLGSFGAGAGVMTLSSLERPPQIVLKPGAPAAAGTPAAAAAQAFAPTQSPAAQVGLPFKNIPLQNIIIQRSPGGTQTLVRPIQPKPLQAGPQTVYSFGLQPSSTSVSAVGTPAAGGPYAANGSMVVQPPGEQQQQQAGLAPGHFLLPSSMTLTPTSTTPSTVQIVAGQNFSAPPGGQLILNQGAVAGSQVGAAAPQTWTGVPCSTSAPVQTSCAPGRLTLVGSQAAAGPVQRLLVTQSQNCASLSSLPAPVKQEPDSRQVRPHAPPAAQQADVITPTPMSPSPPELLSSRLQAAAQQRPRTAILQIPPRGLQNCLFSLFFIPTQDSALHPQVGPSFHAFGVRVARDPGRGCGDPPVSAHAGVPKRPAPQPLTKGGMFLQQLRKDHVGVQAPERRRRFSSLDDALQRLLPYHVFQGAPPSREEFSQVDEEFADVATQVLNRTCAMVNKYRRLLMVEAERSSPSSEMVMIDRTFNQEERSTLTQDKRLVLVDPDGFLEDFCCGIK